MKSQPLGLKTIVLRHLLMSVTVHCTESHAMCAKHKHTVLKMRNRQNSRLAFKPMLMTHAVRPLSVGTGSPTFIRIHAISMLNFSSERKTCHLTKMTDLIFQRYTV